MSGVSGRSLDRYPHWLVNLDATLPVTSHFVIHGNLRDRVLVPAPGKGETRYFAEMSEALTQVLRMSGFQVLLWVQPHDFRVLPVRASDAQAQEIAADLLGVKPQQVPKTVELGDVAALIRSVSTYRGGHVALVLDYVSQWRPPGEPVTEAEHAVFRQALMSANTSEGFRPTEWTRKSALHNSILWMVDQPGDLPGWLVGAADGVRSLPIPMPDQDDRLIAAKILMQAIGASAQAPVQAQNEMTFAQATEGLTLRAMIEVVQLCLDRELGPDRIDDAARAYRLGLLDNPWARPSLRQLISEGSERLSVRVKGQSRAIRQTVDILMRSSLGMTAAYSAREASGPRGVMFFAGPTGVGKTELAKAVTELVFGHERAFIRLDMSEYASPHSEARMIGSPPGYIGHGSGGELTNAVRQRPFSVVLFDEIEKADRSIFDKFLQILSDGRLTDGSGSTVHFSETIIVFTSNWGVPALPEGAPPPHGDEYVSQVSSEVRRLFTDRLERPELLGRIGDNIVVFDYISPDIARILADDFIANATKRAMEQTGAVISIDDATRESLIGHVIHDLSKGGRGVALAVESVFVNPLSRLIFDVQHGAVVRVGGVQREADGWVLTRL